MKKQPYPIAQLTGGVDTSLDATFLVDTNSPNLRAVRFEKGLIKKVLSYSTFGTGLPLTGAVVAIATFETIAGSVHTLIITTDYIYLYDPSATTYSILNKTALSVPIVFTGDEDDLFSFVPTGKSSGGTWTDLFVFTNGVDAIQKWDGSGECDDLGGWSAGSVLAKYLAVFQSRLVAACTTESGTYSPWRVRWSVAGDVEDISGTGSGFSDLIETPGVIVQLIVMKGKLYVIKTDSIWEMVYIGGTDIFRPTIRYVSVGSKAPKGIFAVGENIAILGNYNISLFDGLELTLLDKNVNSLLYDVQDRIINEALFSRVVGAYLEDQQRLLFILPKKGSTFPNLEFSYQLDSQSWTIRERESTAIGTYTEVSKTLWSALTGLWSAQTGVWITRDIAAGAKSTLYGTSAGYVYEDKGLTKSSETLIFETKDWTFEHAQRWVEIRVKVRGGPFYLAYSLDEGNTWSDYSYFAASSITGEFKECVVWVNKTSQTIRVKLISTAEDLEVKWIEPWYVPRVRSVSLVAS